MDNWEWVNNYFIDRLKEQADRQGRRSKVATEK